MQDARNDRFGAALQRWVDSLNTFGEPAVVDAAVAPDVVIHRYGFATQKGQLVEHIVGRDDAGKWCSLSPRSAVFDLPEPVRVVDTDDGPMGVAAFRVKVPDLTNNGRWEFRLADDGRLAWLAHHPGEIEDAVEEHLPMGDRWGAHACEVDAHEHGHDHDHDGHDGHGMVIERREGGGVVIGRRDDDGS